MEASDGRVGIEHQRTIPAEVIITDILMPEQEGFETIRELRRDFPTTGIIAMSGGGQIGCDTLLAIAERLGAQRVLQKSFGLREMLDAVHATVTATGLIGEGTSTPDLFGGRQVDDTIVHSKTCTLSVPDR